MSENSFDNDVTNLIIAMSLLRRRVREVVSSKELSWTQMAVLARLAKEGPSITSDLARAERMKPQSMGSTVAELEGMGLLKRRPHPSDKRQMLIELTEDGITAREAARAEKITWLAQAVAKLSNAERTILFAAADIMKNIAEDIGQ
jgi:DNA-binding MarR family transcriptional regulator